MFFFWGVAIIWFITMIPNVQLPYFLEMPEFIQGETPLGFVAAVSMIWWCFAGFETCCAMGEEIKYPQINIPRALFLAPFIVFAVNAAFQWFLVGIVPTEEISALSTASAPFAEAMTKAGILGFPLILLAAGIAFGGDFSTLNASIAVPPRYLFTMARDGAMPKIFARIHKKYQTPYIAILTLGILSAFLIASNSMVYIASVSLFADLFYYVIGIGASFGLRKKHPELNRPYKAPGIMIGAPVSVIIYIVMITQLEREALITGVVWCALGLVVYGVCRRMYKDEENEEEAGVLQPEIPSPEEKKKMDREFNIWKTVVAAAVIIVLFAYVVPFLI